MLFVPAFVPFTFHWYAGTFPPLTGVAVNVTIVPWQMVLPEAAMETLTGSDAAAVITTWLDATGFPPLMQVALEIIEQVTISPCTGKYENDGVFVPTFVPFTFHW